MASSSTTKQRQCARCRARRPDLSPARAPVSADFSQRQNAVLSKYVAKPGAARPRGPGVLELGRARERRAVERVQLGLDLDAGDRLRRLDAVPAGRRSVPADFRGVGETRTVAADFCGVLAAPPTGRVTPPRRAGSAVDGTSRSTAAGRDVDRPRGPTGPRRGRRRGRRGSGTAGRRPRQGRGEEVRSAAVTSSP